MRHECSRAARKASRTFDRNSTILVYNVLRRKKCHESMCSNRLEFIYLPEIDASNKYQTRCKIPDSMSATMEWEKATFLLKKNTEQRMNSMSQNWRLPLDTSHQPSSRADFAEFCYQRLRVLAVSVASWLSFAKHTECHQTATDRDAPIHEANSSIDNGNEIAPLPHKKQNKKTASVTLLVN